MTETTTSADGTPIAYEKTGSGPALVLVDGALCYREFGPARELAGALADRYTVYFYDRRGRGESGNTLPYEVEREIEDVKAVIDATGGPAFVAGQSSGAGLAYRAAVAGVPMRKLAGYESPWVGLRPNRDGTPRDYLGELQALVAAGERGKAVDYFMTKMVGGPWFLPIVFRLMRKPWKQLRAIAHTLPYDAQIMGAQFAVPVDELATIAVPTLVMGGGKSPANMLDAQERIAEAIPDSRHRILDGQTHQVAASALAPALTEFFGG